MIKPQCIDCDTPTLKVCPRCREPLCEDCRYYETYCSRCLDKIEKAKEEDAED